MSRQPQNPLSGGHFRGWATLSTPKSRERSGLVAHARGDRGVPVEEGRLLGALIPGARLVLLESDNHILLEDEPAWPRFVSEVREFLGTSRS
jgi:pimeloyl-ACP methyl ester carboxylesterase